MAVEKVSSGEAEKIADIIRRSHASIAEQFKLSKRNCPAHPSLCQSDWVKNDMARGVEYFVVRERNKMVGCVSFEKNGRGTAYLNRLSVLPDYRNRGVGRELVSYVLNLADARGLRHVSAGIIAQHHELKNWYGRLGFVEGETKVFAHLPFNVTYLNYFT